MTELVHNANDPRSGFVGPDCCIVLPTVEGSVAGDGEFIFNPLTLKPLAESRWPLSLRCLFGFGISTSPGKQEVGGRIGGKYPFPVGFHKT